MSFSIWFYLAQYPQASSKLSQIIGFPSSRGELIFHCVYIPHFIHSFISRYLSGFHILAIVNNARVNPGYRYSFKILFFLDIYPEVGLLSHMVFLVLIYWETSMLFSKVVILIYILTNSSQGLHFLDILIITCFLLSFWW